MFEKGSNRQNHSSGSLHLVKKLPPSKIPDTLPPLGGVTHHSVHWGTNPPSKTPPPSLLSSPPLNRQTVPAPPPFLGNPPSILVFREPPPESRMCQ